MSNFLTLPITYRKRFSVAYIEQFIKESNLIAGKNEEVDENTIRAWNYLVAKKTLTEFHLGAAHQLIKGESIGMIDDISFNTRKREKTFHNYQSPAPEILKYFIAGWTLYALDHGNALLKALSAHRDFLLATPYPSHNGRLGRLLFLWMMVRNEVGQYYFKSEGSKTYYHMLEDSMVIAPKNHSRYIKQFKNA